MFGFLVMIPPLVALKFVTQNTLRHKVLLCALLFLIGVFVDLVIPALLVELEDLISTKEKETPEFFGKGGAFAQVFGLFTMAQALGLILGSIWSGFVTDKSGLGTTGWSLAILTGFTGIIMFKLGDE